MKKKQKTLLVLSAVLVVLIVAFIAVNAIEKKVEEINDYGQTIISIDKDKVTSFSMTEDSVTLSFTKTDGVWTYDGDTDFPVDEDKINDFLDHFEDVGAPFKIENVTDYSQYGLTSPQGVITINTEDSTLNIFLGDYSVMDSDRYLSMEDGCAYLISDDLMDYVTTDKDDFMKQDEVDKYDDLVEFNQTGVNDLDIIYSPDENHSKTGTYAYYLMEDDNYIALNSAEASTYLKQITSIKLSDYATYTLTDATLDAYGLDDPELTITVSYLKENNEGSYTVYVSSLNSKHYLRVNDSSIVYNLDSDTYTSLTETNENDLKTAEVMALDEDEIKAIHVVSDSVEYIFENDGKKWTYSDQEVDMDDVLDCIEDLALEEFTDETPSKKQEVNFTVETQNGDSILVTIYQKDGDYSLVKMDGKIIGTISRSQVSALKEAFDSLILSLD